MSFITNTCTNTYEFCHKYSYLGISTVIPDFQLILSWLIYRQFYYFNVFCSFMIFPYSLDVVGMIGWFSANRRFRNTQVLLVLFLWCSMSSIFHLSFIRVVNKFSLVTIIYTYQWYKWRKIRFYMRIYTVLFGNVSLE